MTALLQDIHALIPGTCEYVTGHDKRDFAHLIKNMHLEMGRLSLISQVGPF